MTRFVYAFGGQFYHPDASPAHISSWDDGTFDCDTGEKVELRQMGEAEAKRLGISAAPLPPIRSPYEVKQP